MLSDEQLDVLSGALVPLYQHLESWVIADVARRIRDTLKYTRSESAAGIGIQPGTDSGACYEAAAGR